MGEGKERNMIDENAGRETYSFSQSNLQRFIANHLDKFIWICVFTIIALTIAKVGYLSAYGIIVSLFLCMIPYLYVKFQEKFAHRIIIDFTSREIRLHMHRSNAVITADFDDIKSIRANGYIIFVLKERKIFFNDLRNNELFYCLNRIMKIDWGFLCAIWGPSEKVRDALASDRK